MPPWSSRFLGSSSTAPHASSSGSNRLTPTVDSDSEGDDYFAPPLTPAQLQELTSPFASDFPAPPNAPFRNHGHSRSLSDKLPALFGGKKKTPVDVEGSSLPNESYVHHHHHQQQQQQQQPPPLPPHGASPKGKSTRAAAAGGGDDDELETGRCATCDAAVKWPRTRTEFRCQTCLMINDLKPMPPRPSPQPPDPSGRAPPGSNTGRAHPISVDRTRALINRCINDYVQWRLRKLRDPAGKAGDDRAASDAPNGKPPFDGPSGRPVPSPTNLFFPTSPAGDASRHGRAPQPFLSAPGAQFPPRSRSIEPGPGAARKPLPVLPKELSLRPARDAHVPHSPVHPTASHNGRPRTANPMSPRGRHPADGGPSWSPFDDPEKGPKIIFAPLEEYIVHHYGQFESLNVSFVKPRRRGRIETQSVDPAPRPVPPSPSAAPHLQDPFSEIDAKTLLIGDIAENGLWWTGRGNKHDQVGMPARPAPKSRPDYPLARPGSLISSKSPQISFLELTQWYYMVIGAGRDWKYSIAATSDEAVDRIITGLGDAEVANIDAAMAEARAHVHRTLLKTTENLLKRPGRPLIEPADVRFLLIVLANPMLYPGAAGSAPLREAVPKETLTVPHGNSFADAVDPLEHDRSARPLGPWEQGHAFGILKRAFGLLSNVSMEVQRAMVAWLSRYDEQHFRDIVELVGSFVTHRLRRRRGRKRSNSRSNMAGLIPNLSGSQANVSAELHAALGLSGQKKSGKDSSDRYPAYSDDWQLRAVSKVMAMLFAANKNFHGERSAATIAADAVMSRPGSLSRTHIKNHGQLMSTTDFYNSLVDTCDLILDFDTWELTPSKFTFCQYPFFLSVGAKIKIMEHDAKRQMDIKAREAIFKSILRNTDVQSHLLLKVRRECLVEDSLKSISEVVAQGQGEIKKGLKVQFANEEGIDAGGLRKEWFLLLAREIFDPMHGMFTYDDESQFCYFNPYSFETSDQYYLVGALLGLAIYNTVILDVALPPFTFKKLLLSGHAPANKSSPFMRGPLQYTLEDLAEWQPRLAKGLRQLLEFDGDVEATFCRDFVVEVERFGIVEQVPLCPDGAKKPVTNQNRHEFVDLYIRYLLDKQVTRQFEPFKRGFFTVAGGNALSLFQPEEIELLVRGSDEPLDVPSLKAVAIYENWPSHVKYPAEDIPLLQWFWESLAAAAPGDQRKLLGFITGSDRIPAVGATSLRIKVCCGGPDYTRYPIARTCFNQLIIHQYRSRQELESKLWTAVAESEGFGLK